MKKISIIFVIVALVMSSSIPFFTMPKAKAQTGNIKTESNADENNLEYITIESNGSGQINITEETKRISIDLEKHSKIQNDKVEMILPKGFSYDGENEQVNYDEKESKLEVKMEKIAEKIELKLNVKPKEFKNNLAILTATLEGELPEEEKEKEKEKVEEKIELPEIGVREESKESEEEATDGKILTSNVYKVHVVETEEKENLEETVAPENSGAITPGNGAKERITSRNDTTAEESEGEEEKEPTHENDLGNGMTTLEGVPNAVKPDIITHAEGENEVNVSNWDEFYAAMMNNQIHVIHVQEDIQNIAGTTAGNAILSAMPTIRNIKINGNGHIIDFQGTVFYNNTSLVQNQVVQWEINNLTMYGRTWWGPMQTGGTASATGAYGGIKYKDVTYIGSQVTASYYWTIEFEGHIENHSEYDSYISPFDNKKYALETRNSENNIEAREVIFRENNVYNGEAFAAVFVLQQSGAMVLEKNTKVTLTSKGSGGENGSYGLYLNGLLKTGENAELIIKGREAGSQYGIYIAGNGNGIHAEASSKLNLTTHGAYPSIYMQTNTSVIIEDGATLDVNAKNRGTSAYNVVEAPYANSTFIIGKKGTLNVVSDGSGSHILLNFGASALFQFADAQNVNLQFTNDKLSTSARMISMAGSAGTLDVDVQDVKAWNRTDIATNNTREADYHWTPMFGMVTKFVGGTGTVQSASSVMNEEREKYTAEFKPQNFSRLQYSYIADVEVGILNPITDNVSSENSSVVKGVANPGAYVRLTGDPALPEPKVPSIVDGADEAELRDDFTVIADEKGNFEVKAKEGEHFTASNKIKAFAFLGGKVDEHTLEVLDETAPTGEGVNLSMIFGEELPNPKYFVINPQDTNPVNKKFSYEYKEDYSALTNEEAVHNIIIVLADEAGNETDIPVQLEVTKDGYGVKADDFSIQLSELRQYDTEEKMKTFLLDESKAMAYGIIENESIDLTEYLIIDDLANITQMKAGKYEIGISFDLGAENPEAKAKGSFIVTVLNNEAVKPTNPENPGAGEPEEVENEGTGETGLLKLDYAPSTFEFGEVKFGFDRVETNAVKTTSDKQWLQVSDHRAEEDITDWSVQVVQNQVLSMENGDELKGATITIPRGKVYNEETGDEVVTTGQLVAEKVDVTTTPETIFRANNNADVIKDTSTNVWEATDVKLEIPGGQEVEFGDYSNTLTWSLVAEPNE